MSKNATIVVVDDQTEVLRALEFLLGSEGYVVKATTSPEGLLGLLASADSDIVLMDLNYTRGTTSGSDGLELLAEVIKARPTSKVVAMTGWPTASSQKKAMSLGASAYIEKPWDDGALLDLVAQLLA